MKCQLQLHCDKYYLLQKSNFFFVLKNNISFTTVFFSFLKEINFELSFRLLVLCLEYLRLNKWFCDKFVIKQINFNGLRKIYNCINFCSLFIITYSPNNLKKNKQVKIKKKTYVELLFGSCSFYSLLYYIIERTTLWLCKSMVELFFLIRLLPHWT